MVAALPDNSVVGASHGPSMGENKSGAGPDQQVTTSLNQHNCSRGMSAGLLKLICAVKDRRMLPLALVRGHCNRFLLIFNLTSCQQFICLGVALLAWRRVGLASGGCASSAHPESWSKLLYWAAVALMWLRQLQYVLIQQQIGQVSVMRLQEYELFTEYYNSIALSNCQNIKINATFLLSWQLVRTLLHLGKGVGFFCVLWMLLILVCR